eukprot:GHRR01011511.1.p1 GENE.GHRR01011511.1~~GHRR01011511.1.p1  ORF type:complete len:175 (+),score=53.53 GHRR01011511.1:231-755(+)
MSRRERGGGGPRGRDGGIDMMDDDGISTSETVKVVKSFDQMGLRDDLLRGIFAYGFEKPSAIQQRALLPIAQGRDVIAQAQSGTGKSSLIAMSICQMIDTKLREVQALVLSPTRELATQTEKLVLAIGDFMNIQAHACIGGHSVGESHLVGGSNNSNSNSIKQQWQQLLSSICS